jgi:hypothetical protein
MRIAPILCVTVKISLILYATIKITLALIQLVVQHL